jgi:glycosyltransferase involved in cell wall biosynthesis
MKHKITLSVAVATYNEEANIKRCLDSVREIADEIVVVDGGSTDNTFSIVKEYTNNITSTNNPPIFHINKQKAIEKCSGMWILQMDADEEVSDKLAKEIQETIKKSTSTAGYYIARNNYFTGKLMHRGGMYPDYVIRLFKNGKGNFPCKSVHEQIAIDGETGYLKEPLNHYPYPTFSEYLRKANTYTSLTATELQEKNIPKTIYYAFIYLVVKPALTFIMLYVRHKGFQDGWRGFAWALFSGLHHAQAYGKYIKSKNEK